MSAGLSGGGVGTGTAPGPGFRSGGHMGTMPAVPLQLTVGAGAPTVSQGKR